VTTQWKYQGIISESDDFYVDHEFDNGDLCKRHVVSEDKESGEWYGTIFLADDAESPFDDEMNMPPELLAELRAMIQLSAEAPGDA